MDRAGHQFLSGPALPADKNRCGSRSDLTNQRKDFLHGRRLAREVAEDTLIAELPVEKLGFLNELVLLEGAFQERAQYRGLHGFFEEPKALRSWTKEIA